LVLDLAGAWAGPGVVLLALLYILLQPRCRPLTPCRQRGCTPLHAASENHDVAVSRLLIEAKAAVDAKDSDVSARMLVNGCEAESCGIRV
jgi:hypothetical protein